MSMSHDHRSLRADLSIDALLPGRPFGVVLRRRHGLTDSELVSLLEAHPAVLADTMHGANGLVVIHGLTGISEQPSLLLRLSRLVGREVEDYRETGMHRRNVHPDVPEILVVSNVPPATKASPPAPVPPRNEDGSLPVSFPHRRGWHSDQSYRRPPPDVSLFYARQPVPQGQGQTLYADGTTAYASLPDRLRSRIQGLEGLHVQPGTGYSEYAVRAGEMPSPLGPLQQPQRQPLVRHHPVTGEPALYLCEAGQMDWVNGPLVGMQPGVDGDGAALLYELMSHYTRPEHVYVHEWSAGDLVVYDNRCTIHAATWFDDGTLSRIMWRTTVSGNPGVEYAGESPSWLAA
jgi:taurine dioxygenase